MSVRKIPWRDNGLLLAALGLLVFVVLTATEVFLQETHYQDRVISVALQADNETDSEEENETTIALTPEQLSQVNALVKTLGLDADVAFNWARFKSEHPEVSDALWREFAIQAARENYPHSASAVLAYLLKSNPQSEDLLFHYAKVGSDSGQDEQAVLRYQQLLSLHPNHQASYINLGLALARLGRHSAVLEIMAQAIELSSGERKAKAYSIRGSSLVALAEYSAAVQDFNSAIEYRPDHAPTWRKLAKAKMLVGDLDTEVELAYNRAISLKPDSLISLHERARFYWLQGKVELARVELENIRTIAEDYQPARWTLLHLYTALEKENSAGKELKWLRQQQPKKQERILLTGVQHTIDKQWAEASQEFQKLVQVEFNEDNAWALYYLCQATTQLNRPLEQTLIPKLQNLLHDQWLGALATQALANYYIAQDQGVEGIALMQALSFAHPDSHYYAYLLGRMYLDADQPIEAASALQRAVKIDESDTQTLLSLAIAYNRAEQIELALATYEKILSLRENHRAALFNYANVLAKIDQKDDAIDTFNRLLEVDTNNNRARYLLARLYADTNAFTNSNALLQDALAEDATYHLARELLVENYFQQGSLDAALTEVERLLVLERDHLDGLALKSDILRDLGQLQAAAAVLIELMDQYPDNISRNTIIKLYNIGKRALDADELVLAEISNRRVIESDPSFDKAWVNLSSALLKQDKAAEVISLLKDEGDLLAMNSKLTINLAEAYHLAGQSQVAVNLLEPLKQRDLLSGEGQLILAKSYNAL